MPQNPIPEPQTPHIYMFFAWTGNLSIAAKTSSSSTMGSADTNDANESPFSAAVTTTATSLLDIFRIGEPTDETWCHKEKGHKVHAPPTAHASIAPSKTTEGETPWMKMMQNLMLLCRIKFIDIQIQCQDLIHKVLTMSSEQDVLVMCRVCVCWVLSLDTWNNVRQSYGFAPCNIHSSKQNTCPGSPSYFVHS
jgi:hypothetical protein